MGKIITDFNKALESLKILWSTALENGTITFDRWFDQSQQFVSEVWNSTSIQNAHDGFNLAWEQFIEICIDIKSSFQPYNFNNLVNGIQSKIIHLTGNSFNRSHVYIGCAGLFIGGGVGFLIGINVNPSIINVTHMKAVSAMNYKGTESITLLEGVHTPEITESNHVMIMVKASSIDSIDILIASGYGSFIRTFLKKQLYRKSIYREFPIILGRDCSGVVIDLGSNVRPDININDEVWVSLPPTYPVGTLCETLVVPDNYVGLKPNSMSHEQAATIPYSGSIAWKAIFITAKLNPLKAMNKKIFLLCGNNIEIGSIIVQICHYLKTDITVACQSRACYSMKSLGAKKVFQTESISIDQLLNKTPNGYDYVFNTAGENQNILCKQLCNEHGIFIPIEPNYIISDSYGVCRGFFYAMWLKLIYIFNSNKCLHSTEFNFKILNELSAMANSYFLKPVLDKTYMEHEVDRAFKYLESGQTLGKIVIKLNYSKYPTEIFRPSSIIF